MPHDTPPSPSPPDRPSSLTCRAREAGWRLWLVKGSLALILFGMSIVGYRNGIWPIISWPMYARLFEMPPPTLSDLRVDVITADGRRVPFLMREIAPTGEHQMVAQMVHCSQDEETEAVRARCARAIEALARWHIPNQDIDDIELWEVEWEVAPRALPPLARDAPSSERFIGRLPLQLSSASSQ